jgi:hypothetical protein
MKGKQDHPDLGDFFNCAISFQAISNKATVMMPVISRERAMPATVKANLPKCEFTVFFILSNFAQPGVTGHGSGGCIVAQ